MQPTELISQLIILYLEQASGQPDKKWHSAKHKVENRTLLEMIKIYGRRRREGTWNSSHLRFVLFIKENSPLQIGLLIIRFDIKRFSIDWSEFLEGFWLRVTAKLNKKSVDEISGYMKEICSHLAFIELGGTERQEREESSTYLLNAAKRERK